MVLIIILIEDEKGGHGKKTRGSNEEKENKNMEELEKKMRKKNVPQKVYCDVLSSVVENVGSTHRLSATY